jgi:hypothetical protein
MGRMAMAIGLLVAGATLASVALADSSPSVSQSGAITQSSFAAPCGLAVVAFPGALDAAWALASAVYAEKSLTPCGVDEAQARVLCGEAPPSNAPTPLRELAETVGALRADDAPTRALLGDIARRLSVRALLAVRGSGESATAQLFLPDVGAFDAPTYAPDLKPQESWSKTVQSLVRSFGLAPPRPRAPPLATRLAPRTGREVSSRQFYESLWFWGAVGAAALVGGGAYYFAARDSGAPTIHLEVQLR